MTRLMSLIMLLFPQVLSAEVAGVRGGEHADFTRIVVTSGSHEGWRFGRNGPEYELLAGRGITGFDLTRAFARIPRDRLADLIADPTVPDRLRFMLGCDCSATATALDQGMIVIDITGSGGTPAPDPQPGGYHWWARDQDPAAPAALTAGPDIAEDLAPIRDSLLRQIGEGVARGVIDLATPSERPRAETKIAGSVPGVRIALGEIAGPQGSPPPADPRGEECPDAAELALAAWLPPGPTGSLLALARRDLLAEFDRPDEAAILRGARLQLALGFGAEARQTLALLEGVPSPPLARLHAMSWIIDREASPDPAFAGLAGCDSAAALWSLLATVMDPAAPAPDNLDMDAALRTFSALPPHLRRHLGPPLLERLTLLGQGEAAGQLRDAILRAPGPPPPPVVLMDVRYQTALGNDGAAEALARGLMADPGLLAAEAALALTEAAFNGSRQVPPGLPDQLAALQGDHPALRPRLQRAEALAAAMAGDFARAFATLPHGQPDQFGQPGLAEVWQLAAGSAPAEVFLAQAIPGPPKMAEPAVEPAVRVAVAKRLLAFGFPAQAERWLGPPTDATPAGERILMAQAALARRDAQQALRLVAGMATPEAETIRGQAALQLGDGRMAAAAFARSGDQPGRLQAEKLAADWEAVAREATPAWQEAARLAGPSSAVPSADRPAGGGSGPPQAPIASGLELAAGALATRLAVAGLLDAGGALPGAE